MRITWTIMLTNGPLVGEAQVNTVEQGILKVEEAVRAGLGGKWTDQHASGLAKMAAALRTGERSWRSEGVWVELSE